MNLPKTNLTNDKIDTCQCLCHLPPYETNKDYDGGLIHDGVCCDDMNGSLVWEKVKSLIHQAEITARIDEVETAINTTRQTFDYRSPFANTQNIDNQVITATSSYLDNRLYQLQTILGER